MATNTTNSELKQKQDDLSLEQLILGLHSSIGQLDARIDELSMLTDDFPNERRSKLKKRLGDLLSTRQQLMHSLRVANDNLAKVIRNPEYPPVEITDED